MLLGSPGSTAENRSKEKRNLIISLTKSKQKQRYGSNTPRKTQTFIWLFIHI